LFLGTYEHTIDPKGRLFIPAKLRDANGTSQKKFILTQGLESCLYLFEPSTFHNVLVSKLGTMPVKNQQDGRAFKRLLLSGANDVELDDMGRILIPKTLSAFAGLKKSVAILGVGERIELWSQEKWNRYNKQAAQTFQKLGRHLEI
jgi:MraZ protein